MQNVVKSGRTLWSARWGQAVGVMRQEIFEAQGSSAGDPLPGDAQLTAKIQHMMRVGMPQG